MTLDELKVPKQPPAWMFALARIFGRKLTPWSYYWRGRYWVMAGAPLDMPLTETESKKP